MNVLVSVIVGAGVSFIAYRVTDNFLIGFFVGIFCGLAYFYIADGK